LSTNKALVIEKTQTFRAIMGEIFSSCSMEVEFCDSPESAMEVLSKTSQDFELIVVASGSLDEGAETFALQLRTQKDYAHTPLALLTSTHSEFDSRFYAVGFTQLFAKDEIGKFKNYLTQFLARATFSEENNNKVLLIEDDHTQQIVIRSILESKHCQCICFKSAEEALATKDLDIDLIIVDFFLEDRMTGMEFINECRLTEHPWVNTPILATTALDDPARKYEFIRAGANDYLVKPIEPLELIVRVENLLRYKKLLDTVNEQREEMHYLAMHDQLTGLHNRHYMASHIDKKIREALRHSIDCTLLVIDVDHFKQVNDTHGHDKGDLVLKSIAGLLKEQCRTEDIVARFGGEEFIIFLSYCSIENAQAKAEKLRSLIESNPHADISLTASFGIAPLTKTCDSFDTLFKAADEAVYQAKASGRNCVKLAGQ
jgi:two-component system cell cycle response regulator